jgi:hypothetical protein
MSSQATKSLENLEQKINEMDPDSLRYHVLHSAKDFKLSWISLGRSLYTVWKDKLYKEWGFSQFDLYTAKEIGIKKQTALKLLRSYYFLEKEEPALLKDENKEEQDPAQLPSYEAVDVLRLAKNKKTIDEESYQDLKKKVFEEGKDAREVKKDLTSLIRQREELSDEEAWEKKKQANVNRLVGTLSSLKQEAVVLKLLPAPLLKEITVLIEKLKQEVT